jgi:hypothetical protein
MVEVCVSEFGCGWEVNECQGQNEYNSFLLFVLSLDIACSTTSPITIVWKSRKKHFWMSGFPLWCDKARIVLNCNVSRMWCYFSVVSRPSSSVHWGQRVDTLKQTTQRLGYTSKFTEAVPAEDQTWVAAPVTTRLILLLLYIFLVY